MKKILLVDDDPLSVEFMRLFIESDGFMTLSACSCAEAKAAVDEHAPDIIVTDVELTDGSGVDLAHYAKSKGNPCIIGVTGHSAQHLSETGNDITVFSTLLLKPIELDRLRAAIG